MIFKKVSLQNRITSLCNSLPDNVVLGQVIRNIQKKSDNLWIIQDMKYNGNWELKLLDCIGKIM